MTVANIFSLLCFLNRFNNSVTNASPNCSLPVDFGGGSYNNTLVEMLRNGLREEKCSICIQEDIGHSSAAKEAIAFAILANETYHRNPSNVPSATGAKNSIILGNITFPPYANENEANI